MNFIDDEHFVAAVLGRNAHAFPELMDVVDFVVGGGVDFDDVEGLGERLAVDRLVDLVDFPRQNSGHGGFSDAARPAEHVGVGQPVRGDRIAQGAADVLLRYDVIERKRSVCPG